MLFPGDAKVGVGLCMLFVRLHPRPHRLSHLTLSPCSDRDAHGLGPAPLYADTPAASASLCLTQPCGVPGAATEINALIADSHRATIISIGSITTMVIYAGECSNGRLGL